MYALIFRSDDYVKFFKIILTIRFEQKKNNCK